MSYKRFQRRELTLEEHVRMLLEQWRPRFNAPANDDVIVSDANAALTARREALLDIIDKAAEERRIIYAPAVDAALQAAKARHPHHSFDSFGFEKRVFDKAEYLKFDITSATVLGDVMEAMIDDKDERVPLSAFGKQCEQQQAQAKNINMIIQRITRGKPEFPLPQNLHKKYLGVDHGRAKNIASTLLDRLSLEALREIDQAVASYRNARDGVHVAPSATQSDEGVAATAPAQKSIPFMGGETDLANPKTGAEFTKAEIHWLVKNDLPMFRKLMARNTKRLNEILAQQS
jgi:hypothetical protein